MMYGALLNIKALVILLPVELVLHHSIAILRQLHRDNQLAGNTLFFSNKTEADIIYKEELTSMLDKNAVYILSREQKRWF